MAKATNPQIHYIECLAIDLGFDRQTRNYVVSDIAGRTVKFLDELTKDEASRVITDFQERKYGDDAEAASGYDPTEDYRK